MRIWYLQQAVRQPAAGSKLASMHLERLTKRSESRQVGADGAQYMPIPSTGRARLTVSAVVLLAAL
ncbi:hypothetical protein ACDH50_04950, partial [Xanthomonas fragariae]